MADARLKALFKRAAEIAGEVPEEFQEAAFHRALDVLVGNAATRDAQGYAEYLDEAAAEAQAPGLPKAAAKLILDKSFDVLNLATGVLGIEALSADQVTKVLNEGYGLVVSNEMVSRTLENADGLVSRVRSGGNTLYHIMQPANILGLGAPRRSSPGKKQHAETRSAAAKAAAKGRAKAGAGGGGTRASGKQKATASKKSAQAQGGRKKKSGPREIVVGLVKAGFFNTARTVTDVALYLQRRGIEITARELSGILLRLLRAGLLERAETPSGRYKYYAAE